MDLLCSHWNFSGSLSVKDFNFMNLAASVYTCSFLVLVPLLAITVDPLMHVTFRYA